MIWDAVVIIILKTRSNGIKAESMAKECIEKKCEKDLE